MVYNVISVFSPQFMMFSSGARIGFFTGNVRKITEDLKALR